MRGTGDPEGVEGRRIEAYLRGACPAIVREHQESVLERLDRLSEAGPIDVGVQTWAKRAAVDDEASLGVRKYGEFAAWAREANVTIRPFFDTRTCYSSIAGRPREVLVAPVVCIAAYADDNLRAVYPHADDGRTYTVGDFLSALEDEEPVDPGPESVVPAGPAD